MMASLEPIPPGKNVNTPINEAIGTIVIVDIGSTLIPIALNAMRSITPFKTHMSIVYASVTEMVFLLLYLINES